MARIRTIKPEFFEDEGLAKLPPHDRLLFIGLWLLADKNGVLEDRPAWIQAKVFPYESGCVSDVSQMLPRLVSGGYIVRYHGDGRDLIMVRNFAKHQRITGKEAQGEGRFPLPRHDELTGKHPGSTREAPGVTPDAQEREQGTGNREQGTGAATTSPPPSGDDLFPATNAQDPRPRPGQVPKADWHHWRRTHPRLWVNRSDEDGSLADWQKLHAKAGDEVMGILYDRLTEKLPESKKINYAMAVEWIAKNCTET